MKNIKEEFGKFQQWLREHKDNYVQLLAEKPYCIEVKFDNVFGHNLAVFKYNQIDSDFSQPFVKLCRGLILDADTFDVVSFPFVKFHNYGEMYADDIDWKSCYVTEKLDGSIVKVVRLGNELLISTNSTIDAYKAPLMEQIGCKAKSFGELIDEAVVNAYKENHSIANDGFYNPITVDNWFYYLFDEGKTYMFELTSPFNKIVVPWKEIRLNFLGVRDNSTFEETFFGDHPLKDVFNTPKVFPLTSANECIEAAGKLDSNAEGYVVCDKSFNRIKIKSPLYVAIHHLRGENGVISYRRALEIVKKNEVDEVLTYFPEYKSAFDDLSFKFNAKVKELEDTWNDFISIKNTLLTRKDQAIWLTSHCKTPGLLFSMLDGKIKSIHDGLYDMPNENMLKMLGFKTLNNS